jgi:hypothetical protein
MISKAPKLSLSGTWKVPNRLVAHVMTSKHPSTINVRRSPCCHGEGEDEDGGTNVERLKIFGRGLCQLLWKQSKDKWRDFYVISW